MIELEDKRLRDELATLPVIGPVALNQRDKGSEGRLCLKGTCTGQPLDLHLSLRPRVGFLATLPLDRGQAMGYALTPVRCASSACGGPLPAGRGNSPAR